MSDRKRYSQDVTSTQVTNVEVNTAVCSHGRFGYSKPDCPECFPGQPAAPEPMTPSLPVTGHITARLHNVGRMQFDGEPPAPIPSAAPEPPLDTVSVSEAGPVYAEPPLAQRLSEVFPTAQPPAGLTAEKEAHYRYKLQQTGCLEESKALFDAAEHVGKLADHIRSLATPEQQDALRQAKADAVAAFKEQILNELRRRALPKPRPTIAELEKILAQPDEQIIEVAPDGSVSVGGGIIAFVEALPADTSALRAFEQRVRLEEAEWWNQRQAHRKCVHCRVERGERIAALREKSVDNQQ